MVPSAPVHSHSDPLLDFLFYRRFCPTAELCERTQKPNTLKMWLSRGQEKAFGRLLYLRLFDFSGFGKEVNGI